MKNDSMSGLADPVHLSPSQSKDGLLNVIVETPKGSRNKFAYDPELKIFALSRVLPAGMTFPLDFGLYLERSLPTETLWTCCS